MHWLYVGIYLPMYLFLISFQVDHIFFELAIVCFFPSTFSCTFLSHLDFPLSMEPTEGAR